MLYLKHYRRIGNFKNPTLFSEKMQWRIIHDRREILRLTCDKRASKRVVLHLAAEAGVELLAPRQLAWSSDADALISELRERYAKGELPERWVMKPNHSSGRALAVVGVPDWTLLTGAAHAWLRPSRFSGLHWIWPYVTADVGLLAEEYVPSSRPPIEWQLWMMSGRVVYIVAQQRINDRPSRSIFNDQWRPVEPWYNREAQPLVLTVPPKNWKKIERVGRALGGDWDMIRVDIYEDEGGRIWFSELTPFPQEGLFGTGEGASTFDELAGKAWLLPAPVEERAGG
jgi:hypothetical protein